MCCDGTQEVCITTEDMTLRHEGYKKIEGKIFHYSPRITKTLLRDLLYFVVMEFNTT